MVEELIKNEKRVVLISDMYFSSSIIRTFLNKFSPIFNNIPIYMSSEFRLKKNSGNLFKAILNLEKVDPKNGFIAAIIGWGIILSPQIWKFLQIFILISCFHMKNLH